MSVKDCKANLENALNNLYYFLMFSTSIMYRCVCKYFRLPTKQLYLFTWDPQKKKKGKEKTEVNINDISNLLQNLEQHVADGQDVETMLAMSVAANL